MKRKSIILILTLSMVLTAAAWAIANTPIKMLVNGQEIKSDVAPLMQNDRVMVPVRFISEALGCEVIWDKENQSVVITKIGGGDKYLQGKNDPNAAEPSIHSNFVKAPDLLAVLDDDKDNDLCDYRDGHCGGDNIANDPLVVDLRTKKDYDAGHIPGAIFIAAAQDISNKENSDKLRQELAAHVAKGGKNEIVVYCFTAHTAGLAAGVLGADGFNVKNLRFGYSITWEGTKSADATIYGPREDVNGNAVPYPIPETIK